MQRGQFVAAFTAPCLQPSTGVQQRPAGPAHVPPSGVPPRLPASPLQVGVSCRRGGSYFSKRAKGFFQASCGA